MNIAAALPHGVSAPASGARLVQIARLAAGGRWRVEAMRAYSEPCFLWFTKGQGRITVQGQTRGYTPHNGIYLPPGVMHGFETGPQVFGTALFFGKDYDACLPASPLHLRVREVQAQQEANVLLDAIQREITAISPGHQRAAHHYLGLLGVWIERQASKLGCEAAPQDAARRLVARYTCVLEQDFRSGMGVAEFAASLGVTATHLTRCCKQACGRPASDLLQDRRIYEARRLLSETKDPVNHIAQSLGFTSAAYFTRAFQNLTGCSPTAFRRAGDLMPIGLRH